MFRTALIILALVLASCVSAPAHAGDSPVTAGNKQEAIRGEAEEGNLQEATHILFFSPETFFCDPPGPEAKTPPKAGNPSHQARPIPSGKQLKDLCPPGAIAYPVYAHIPRDLLPPPFGTASAGSQKPYPDTAGKSPATGADTGTTARHP
jgi:hypothetical protein